jgi:hypothetical protein
MLPNRDASTTPWKVANARRRHQCAGLRPIPIRLRQGEEAQRSVRSVARRGLIELSTGESPGAMSRLIARRAPVTLINRIVDSSALLEGGDNTS